MARAVDFQLAYAGNAEAEDYPRLDGRPDGRGAVHARCDGRSVLVHAAVERRPTLPLRASPPSLTPILRMRDSMSQEGGQLFGEKPGQAFRDKLHQCGQRSSCPETRGSVSPEYAP